MPLIVSQARNEMCAVLKNALALPANSTYANIKVLWDDVDGDSPADTETPWLRHTIKHTLGGDASLSGADGRKRRARSGTLAVSIFAPIGDGNVTSDALVSIIMAAYEGGSTPNGVWFRKVRFQEVGKSGGWNQTNVLADFEYDQFS